jgi:threonine synthase
MMLRCQRCGYTYPIDTRSWQCTCGGVFELDGAPPFREDRIDRSDHSLWRYAALLPPVVDQHRVSLGEGLTPLLRAPHDKLNLYHKLEFLAPTGSFKDRGSTVLVSLLSAIGVPEVVEDSSGNAGSSLAAYCARAGITTRIFVPEYTSPGKLAQMRVYGANLVKVPGPRERSAEEVHRAAEGGSYYASHCYNPFVLEGVKTIAYEIAEQLDWVCPDNLIVPVGNGTLLLGIWKGFRNLVEAGAVDRLPRLHAVQADSCAPVFRAFESRATDITPTAAGKTIAEGIAIAAPVRGREILAAVRESGGSVVTVADQETVSARGQLASLGLYVEPTSATAQAAIPKLAPALENGHTTIIVLTGSGMKNSGRQHDN